MSTSPEMDAWFKREAEILSDKVKVLAMEFHESIAEIDLPDNAKNAAQPEG